MNKYILYQIPIKYHHQRDKGIFAQLQNPPAVALLLVQYKQ